MNQRKGFYTSGQFAKKANVSIRTIRYYDKQGLLKPAGMSDGGYRLYTDSDFAKLQKILSLKYLGFSLDEIRSITINDDDNDYVEESLRLQLNLIRKRMEHLKLVEQTLTETSKLVTENKAVDWNEILHLIHITNMEKSLVEQYKDAANINIRIGLHKKYTKNPTGWFQWLYGLMEPLNGKSILELGCGNGELWHANKDKLPLDARICLSDVSKGMIRDVEERLKTVPGHFAFEVFDCRQIPKQEESCDIAAANHVLFYLSNLDAALKEVQRILKPDGVFYCSTYGRDHMKEIGQLVKEFDSRITLSEVNLYDVFGLENGEEILKSHFGSVEKKVFKDYLEVSDAGALMEYILSCHGNQQEYLSDRYDEFREFLEKKMEKKGFLHITKQAGAFICIK
ncbi:MerR family transcriptional regulator [Clostridium sp. Marseille-P2415]|uniref:MerR family transcriptional regulator n=1 Tax=Clostridium sp. Marseille-P2415 TaxID=1805471 RepID=UPI0009889157|nr:MerR family transcriptional regulator [Clostridium sp. Marseille-P2415]